MKSGEVCEPAGAAPVKLGKVQSRMKNSFG